MDFSPDELDVSPPCFLVENSQADESQQLGRSDSDQHLAILKQLPIFRVATRAESSAGNTTNDLSAPRNPVAVTCPTTGGEGGGKEEGDPSREQGDGGQQGGGSDSSGGGDDGGGDGGGDDGGGGGGEGGGGDAGGGDGGGGDDDDDENNGQDPSTNEEESPHSEEPSPSSSSDAIPSLIRPETVVSNSDQFKGEKVVVQVFRDARLSGADVSHESGGSVHESPGSGDNYSQASTGIVGEGGDVAADVSEASTAPMEEERKSTSSSSVGHKSEQGSTISSSSYHGDLSSLSTTSGGSLQVSPEVRKHLPLLPLLRTQSTSDTSTSSAGSKEEKVHSKITGFKLFSLSEEEENGKEEPEVCSSQEDLFASSQGHQEKGHLPHQSADDSHFLSPQHRSTPVDGQSHRGSQEHAHEKSLYKQVLTTKQRTSTPVEGGHSGFLHTPPSQGTPIDNIAFKSLQFSGEPSVRETSSSSSSDKVAPSPETYSSIPALDPSSPTASDEEQAEGKTSRKDKSSDKGSSERDDQVNDSIVQSGDNRLSVAQEHSEISRAAAALVQSFDLSQSQEKQSEKPASLKHKETSDDDEVVLPRWQQQQQQEVLQQGSAADEKKSTSNTSSSQGSSSDDQSKGESQPPQVQQWQSVISVLGSSSSGPQGTKADPKAHASNADQEQSVQVVDVSFLENSEAAPLVSKAESGPKEESQGVQLSLSPSSLVVDPFGGGKGAEESPVLIPGPTQPDMSEDMFRPVVTQESKEQQALAGDQPMEEETIPEDSQDVAFPFSLHLTQSQADLDSQAAPEASQPMEVIQQEVTVVETIDDVSEDKSAETIQKEETVASLTKQDSSSQSILAPLIKPLPKESRVEAVKDQEQQNAEVPRDLPEKLVLSRHPLQGEEERVGEAVDNVHEKEDPHPSTDNVNVVIPPEKLVLAEDSGGVAPPKEESATEELANAEQLSTPEKDVQTRRPVEPRLPVAIFSETSSESGIGGFHFSLPKEPLRPLISTTPPPIRPVRQDTPDSEERSSRRSIIPDVVLLVVTETPGMSSQAPPSSLEQIRPPSLTVSMPRLGSPQSDSESSEPVFHFEPALPPASTTPGTSADLQPSAPAPPRSIFSRAREAITKSKKREVVNDSDPFAFTAEDEAPEPVRKKPRRGSPRGKGSPRATGSPRGTRKEIRLGKEVEDDNNAVTREASTSKIEEGPSREEEEVAKPSSLQERAGAKRARQESSESSESEASEERSKRARKEEDEPKQQDTASSEAVHYQQITHERIITTVTTQVQRVVTVSIVDKETGNVVEVLTYEEDGDQKVESKEEEKEQVHEFLETSSLGGSRVTLTSKTPKRQEQQQQSRSSPRMKKDKSPVATRSASKSVERASTKPVAVIETPGKSGADRGSEESGNGKGDDPPSRDEPTIEIPAVTRQTTMPVVEEETDLKRTSSSDSSLTPGTRVLAKWLDSYFYPGVITTKQYKNGRYLVTFDDGDKRRIPRENLIIKDLLPAGQSVMAQGDGEDDFFEEGVIVGHYRDGNARGYEIQTQTGAMRRYPRSRVILAEQQAAAILSSESSFNVTSGSSLSIGVQSLRLRKDGSGSGSGASLPHDITKSGSTSSKDTSESSSDEKARGRNVARASPHASNPMPLTKAASASTDITPKSTHKSSHKVKAKARRAGHRIGESESSSDEQHRVTASKRRPVKRGLSSSYDAKLPSKLAGNEPFQVPTRRSPRKQSSEKEDPLESPCLPGNRNIFAGLAFLVTGVTRDKNEPEESDSESERIEFNRDHLKRQIEAGGGVVLTSFTQSQISGAECFLISHTHQRTQKYFQSLASGIPCVSHTWINDSCACDKRLDYKRYLLPAGESLELGEIVECRPRRNILGDMRVYLHGSQQFKDTWSSVLLAAGCKMVTKLPSRVDYQCDVVICEDNKLPASVKHAADLLGIPIVSLEWLLQSLINGRQVDFDGHPKYDYRYKNV
ncbi:hypothetical protein ACROYT_G006018 [Oculina patagonica]